MMYLGSGTILDALHTLFFLILTRTLVRVKQVLLFPLHRFGTGGSEKLNDLRIVLDFFIAIIEHNRNRKPNTVLIMLNIT